MQNVTMKMDAATVQRIVEQHINESLATSQHARVVAVYGAQSVQMTPNQPSHELTVTFDVVPAPVFTKS